MNQDEIIEMARQIATQASKVGPYRTWTHEYAMSLIMQLVDVSAAKEREACADLCATFYDEMWEEYAEAGNELAEIIRARGEA